MSAWSNASSRTLIGRPGNRALCSSAVAMMALLRVSGLGHGEQECPSMSSHVRAGMVSVGNRTPGVSDPRSWASVGSRASAAWRIAEEDQHGR